MLQIFLMGCQILSDVFSAIFSTAGWAILGLLALLVFLFRRQIAATWTGLTEWVIEVLTWVHLSESLPEDYEAPWPFTGHGGARETIELAEGEQPEFVLIPPPMSLWIARQPVSNPGRNRINGLRQGAPPLLLVAFALPLLTMTLVWLVWTLLWFFSPGLPVFPPTSFLALVAIGGLFLLIPVYWVYEWNRRHCLLIVTTLMAYVLIVKALTRQYHRSPNPMHLIEEVILDSSWSEGGGVQGFVGGWLHKLFGIGDAFFGTRVERAGDMVRRFPHISTMGEIFQQLNSDAKARKFQKELALKLGIGEMYNGAAEEAIMDVGMAGGYSPYGKGLQKMEAILEQFRRNHPGGGKFNFVDPGILGFTRWDFNTGELLEPEDAAA